MNRAGKNCTVTRIGRLWDAILVTDDGFGALMCQKCAQSQIRLGEWAGGGGIPLGGGGRRTENRDQMCTASYMHIRKNVHTHTHTHTHTHAHAHAHTHRDTEILLLMLL